MRSTSRRVAASGPWLWMTKSASGIFSSSGICAAMRRRASASSSAREGALGSLRHAVHITGHAQLDGRGDENDSVEALSPAGRGALPVGLKDERRLDHDHGVGVFRENVVGPLLLRRDDGRMHDLVQLGEAVLPEGEVGQKTAVKRAVGADHFRPEVPDDFVVDGVARETSTRGRWCPPG